MFNNDFIADLLVNLAAIGERILTIGLYSVELWSKVQRLVC